MKIIKQEAHLLDTTGMSEYQVIEKVGRTCYKSEDKITDESAVKFVTSLVKSGHHAMIEFGFIYLKITDIMFWEWFVSNCPDFIHHMNEYVSGSFRAFYDWYAGLLKPVEDGGWVFSHEDPIEEMLDLLDCISRQYPEVFSELANKVFDEYGDDGYLSEELDPNTITYPFKMMDRDSFFADIPEVYKTNGASKMVTPHIVMFRTNRGVSHEMVRHRPCSFAQESTRYCDYNKSKFGGELTVIEPLFEKGTSKYATWHLLTGASELAYQSLIAAGATPQEARGVLTNDLKTDIWVGAFEDQWQHIINLRYHGTTGAPHPQIKEAVGLAYPQLVEASEGRLK